MSGSPPTSTGTATAAEPGKWNEAPMLRQRVEAGELPPVEQRLPQEPLVVEVLEGIGREVVSLTRRHAFYADRLRQTA